MKIYYFAILLFFIASSLFSQTQDTLSTSLQNARLNTDTTQQKKSGIDSSVTYTSSDSIVFSVQSKMMKMYGQGTIKYKNLSLNAERVNVDWNKQELEAVGVEDTTKTDSTKYRGSPIMAEGSDKYDGEKIAYNFRTQKGRITLGKTSQGEGYYHGEHVKKVDKNTLFIANGRFTTCDLGHPHYYFFSPEMKVTLKDKIAARPIYLYITDVPIFALPFGLFPSKGGGRQSGIIAPALGDDARRGRYIYHLGYYEAISDYMDLAVAGDWYPSTGAWKIYPEFRYAKRYDFSGGISGMYAHELEGEKTDTDYRDEKNYRVTLRHNQQFNPTSRLDVDFTFTSNNSYRATNTYQDYLNQEIYSNATYSKSWEGTGNSININIARTQNLQNGNIDATLPKITFSHSQSYPFRFSKKKSSEEYSWYEQIGMNYNGQFLRKDNKTKNTTTNIFDFYQREGISHTLNFSTSTKLGYFNLSPSFNYLERWYNKSIIIENVDTTNAPIKKDNNGFEAVRTFSTGASLTTKLYGMFPSPFSGLVGFRHTLTPTLRYTYQPDFSKPVWGYYSFYKDSSGKEIKYNRFEKEVFGGASAGESQSLSFSVGNLFETKTAPKDTSQKPEKYQLLNLNAGVSYNFAAEEMKLSPLSVDFRTNIGNTFNIGGRSNFSFYVFDQNLKRRINTYLFDAGKGIVQMTDFNISISTSLSGERKKTQSSSQISDSVRIEEYRRNQQNKVRGIYEEDVADFSIPWNLSMSFNFSQNQNNPKNITRSANISADLGFNLTESWKFTASSSYDLIRKEFAAPVITINRDLHCWEMNFRWYPTGQLAGYRFEIRVKAPQLQDIKVTKESRGGF